MGEGLFHGDGGGAVVGGVADGLHPAIDDFITLRVAGGGFLQEGKGGLPILPTDVLAGFLEEFIGFRLGMQARPGFERGADGLMRPGDLPEDASLSRNGSGALGFQNRFPARFGIAPILSGQLEPAALAVEDFLHVVATGRNDLVDRAVGGGGLEKQQLVANAQAAGPPRQRRWRPRQTVFLGGEEFHDGELLRGGVAQSNGLEQGRRSFVQSVEVVEEFGVKEQGFVSGFVFFKQGVQTAQGLVVLTAVNQPLNGAEGDLLFGGSPVQRGPESWTGQFRSCKRCSAPA